MTSILKIINNAKNNNSTKLDLSHQGLTEIPQKVFELSNLEELDLSANQLTSIPESITKLTNLTIIKFGDSKRFFCGNQLTSIPESITQLSKLKELDLSSNQLTTVPKSVTKLDNLNRLYLSNNKLDNVPESITSLSNLTELSLRNNQLKTIPESITHLTKLTDLDLENNQLVNLPKSLTKLNQLTSLNLIHNQLETLPESITRLSSLTSLNLFDNPLNTPPIEIASKGIAAIREYFRQLEEEGEDYLYEAKLLILGQAGAGKTTLAKKIQNPDYQLQSQKKITEGINVLRWSFLDNRRKFNVNIWDFGGQEIYHATHQFFLTKRSLYTLVVDSRKEDTDFNYWLNLVRLLSDNSPLLIIKNEKQNRKKEINDRALRGQFTSLKETLATNLATNRGLENILTNIQDYIKKLPHIGQALPKTWVKVRQALENDDRNYISLQEYFDLCKTNGFSQREDKLQLSQYLHDIGVCLHFQDEEDSPLYKIVILQPKWVTDAVYRVLDNEQVINNQGFFNRDNLKQIWREEKYNSVRGELLELMKKFQLCYEISEIKDNFIAPQLLSVEAPKYYWEKSNNLILRYKYPDFMPKGIINRFIVIMHQWIDKDSEVSKKQYVWRSGVVINKDGTRAEVIEYYGKREIIICVTGRRARDLMTVIINELDKISNSFHGLKYKKLIPCNCESCLNSENPHSYDYQQLWERLNNQKYTIECNKKPFHEVQILKLIDHNIVRKELENPPITPISLGQDKQSSQEKFKIDVIIALITMFLTVLTILFNGVFTDVIKGWLNSVFSRPIPESSQDLNEGKEAQLEQDELIPITSPSIP